jgi:hypothetical protein
VKIRHGVIGAILAFLALCLVVPTVPLVLLIAVGMFLSSLNDLRYDADLLNRLRAVSSKSGVARGEDVTAGIVAVLPVGTPAEQAIRYLSANGFKCDAKGPSTPDGKLVCKRQAGTYPCGETWVVRLTWAPNRTIADRRATLDVVCV